MDDPLNVRPVLQLADRASAPACGRLYVEIWQHGELIEVFEETNLVVDASKDPLAHLIGGTSQASNAVTQIGFGTNGTAPAAGNTALTSAFTKAIDTVTYPSTGVAQFNFTLATTEANGKAILEFGLLTAAGALFARRVRAAALNKDTDISLAGNWQITF